MQKPVSLEVDFDPTVGPLGYLRYRVLEPGKHVTRTQRVHDVVHADFNAKSEILGIELLAFDDEALIAAREFAEANDLEFPELLKRQRFAEISTETSESSGIYFRVPVSGEVIKLEQVPVSSKVTVAKRAGSYIIKRPAGSVKHAAVDPEVTP